MGKIGLLISGRGCARFEPILISYMTMICRERFVKYFYARVFLMDESLRKIRHLINHYDEDPNSIDAVRKLMSEVSRGVSAPPAHSRNRASARSAVRYAGSTPV